VEHLKRTFNFNTPKKILSLLLPPFFQSTKGFWALAFIAARLISGFQSQKIFHVKTNLKG